MKNRIIIEDIKDLKSHFGLRKFLSYPTDFEILIPQFAEKDKNAFTLKIEKYASHCGCESGQRFVLWSPLLYLILCFFSVKIPTGNHFINVLIFIFFGGFIGKLLGLMKAGMGLQRVIKEIENKLS